MEVVAKRVNHFLKSYKGLKKLSESPKRDVWSIQASTVMKDIELTINDLQEKYRRILVNRFITQTNKKLTRLKMCQELEITVKEFDSLLEKSLLEFAEKYRKGVLKKID